jgi:hypothetical protein
MVFNASISWGAGGFRWRRHDDACLPIGRAEVAQDAPCPPGGGPVLVAKIRSGHRYACNAWLGNKREIDPIRETRDTASASNVSNVAGVACISSIACVARHAHFLPALINSKIKYRFKV